MEFINWILMQKSDYSSKRVQDFPEIDAESSCLGFGPVLVVVGWISSGIPPIITLNKIMMMVSIMRMGLMTGRHELRSFLAATSTQNYFLIVHFLIFSPSLQPGCQDATIYATLMCLKGKTPQDWSGAMF